MGPKTDCAIARVDAADQPEALGLLLTGRPVAGGPAVDHFLRHADTHKLQLDQLWLATVNRQPAAAALVVPNPGRTGMLFVSPLLSPALVGPTAALVKAAAASQDPAKVRLLQALLEPSQTVAADALAAAGFRELAHLLYMQRRGARNPQPLQLPDGLEAVHYSPEHRALFERAIQLSYEQTLDCPGLVGLRDMADIIAGHMGTGQFDPQLWYALHCGEEPVGVMLLSAVPQQRALELVYLGLGPAWRGRGIARRLLEHGLGVVKQASAGTMILAVDESNTPAFQLYRSAEFVTYSRKLAMIFVLG